MPKARKTTAKKSSTSVQAGDKGVAVGRDLVNSNVFTGDNNTIIQQVIEKQLTISLFTILAPVGDFTGRKEELAELKAAFERGAIITGMTGGGGIGKTELARKLAQEIAENYPDARMNIDLLGTSEKPLTSEEAMRRLLEPLYPNQKLPDDTAQLQGLFQLTFASKKALLLLDNAANAGQVRPLIPPAPSAAIVTSRFHFSLTEFGLNPLRLDVLAKEDAVLLLRSSSEKLKDEADEVALELANLCGRLPLALRVASSILNDSPTWTPQTLISRLRDEHTRLKRLTRDGDHDLDVEATLTLSYDLLSDELKKYFRQACVLTAPFVIQSVKAVWGLAEDDDVSDLLEKLVNRSLLNYLSEGPGYYSLHDLTRVFGFEKLLEDEEVANAAIMAHANHFLEWAKWSDDQYKKGNENILLGLSQFRFIWPHLFSAYERLLPNQKTAPRSQEADSWLSNFPSRCVYVLDLHLPPRQKIPILETALDASRRLSKKGAEGVHLGNLGVAYKNLGEARKAIEFYEQALMIDREIGDRRGEGADLGNLGLAYAALGDERKAIEFYEKQLTIVREIGDRRGEGNALGNLGNAYAALGDARKAIEFYEKALIIDREIGDRRGEGNALGNLGNAYAALGDARKAIEFYEQALLIAREIGDRRGEGADLGCLGVANAALGDARKAIEFYEQAMMVAQEIGDKRNEGSWLGNLGNVYAALGDARKAIEFYEKAMIISQEIGDRRNEGSWLGNLGITYKTIGEKEKAHQLWQNALAIFEAIESPHTQLVKKWLSDLD